MKHGHEPVRVLQSATMINAEALGWQDQIGSIDAGKFADLVAVAGDPGRYHRGSAREICHEGRKDHQERLRPVKGMDCLI